MAFAFGSRVNAASLTGNTLQLVDQLTLSSGGIPSVTLSIPTGYVRVRGCFSGRSDTASAADSVLVRLNADSAAHYNYVYTQANNGSVSTADNTGKTAMLLGTIPAASATANYAGSGSFIIDDVQSGGTFPSAVGTATGFVTTSNMYNGVYAGNWLSTAAVTTVTFLLNAGNWASGSSFSLYGLT